MTRWHVRKGDSPRTPWEVCNPDGRAVIHCSHHGRAVEHANRFARRIRPGYELEVSTYPGSVIIAQHNDRRGTYDLVQVPHADLPALITALAKAKEQA